MDDANITVLTSLPCLVAIEPENKDLLQVPHANKGFIFGSFDKDNPEKYNLAWFTLAISV
jgi:meiotically up-regulated gene 157 (Mug157) protein